MKIFTDDIQISNVSCRRQPDNRASDGTRDFIDGVANFKRRLVQCSASQLLNPTRINAQTAILCNHAQSPHLWVRILQQEAQQRHGGLHIHQPRCRPFAAQPPQQAQRCRCKLFAIAVQQLNQLRRQARNVRNERAVGRFVPQVVDGRRGAARLTGIAAAEGHHQRCVCGCARPRRAESCAAGNVRDDADGCRLRDGGRRSG